MVLLSEGNSISFYISLISFVASMGRRNWQQIEVYIMNWFRMFYLWNKIFQLIFIVAVIPQL